MALAHSDAAEQVRINYEAKRAENLPFLIALMLDHYGDDHDSLVADAKKHLHISPEETLAVLPAAIVIDQATEGHNQAL